MRERRRLARPRAGDDQQRRRPGGIADAVLDRDALGVVEVVEGLRTNQGGGHGGRKQGLRFVRKGGARHRNRFWLLANNP